MCTHTLANILWPATDGLNDRVGPALAPQTERKGRQEEEWKDKSERWGSIRDRGMNSSKASDRDNV